MYLKIRGDPIDWRLADVFGDVGFDSHHGCLVQVVSGGFRLWTFTSPLCRSCLAWKKGCFVENLGGGFIFF